MKLAQIIDLVIIRYKFVIHTNSVLENILGIYLFFYLQKHDEQKHYQNLFSCCDIYYSFAIRSWTLSQNWTRIKQKSTTRSFCRKFKEIQRQRFTSRRRATTWAVFLNKSCEEKDKATAAIREEIQRRKEWLEKNGHKEEKTDVKQVIVSFCSSVLQSYTY